MNPFSRYRPPPRDQQLMVRPNTWNQISPHYVPAVNISQLATNEMSRLIALAPYLTENERASFKTETSYTNKNSETETYTVEVEFGKRYQSITYRREIR